MAGSSERPILDELVEKSRDRFWLDSSPYNNVDYSANLVVSELNVPSIDLMRDVISQTTLSPRDLLMFDKIVDAEGWDELFGEITRLIVAEELLRRYPDIKQEDDENRTAAPPREEL